MAEHRRTMRTTEGGLHVHVLSHQQVSTTLQRQGSFCIRCPVPVASARRRRRGDRVKLGSRRGMMLQMLTPGCEGNLWAAVVHWCENVTRDRARVREPTIRTGVGTTSCARVR